jgi:hypothetical protein
MRNYTMILEDGFNRRYRAFFSQARAGQMPRLAKIERETIAFTAIDHIMIRVWSLHRESCHGKFNASLKDAIRAAMVAIASSRE